MTVPIVRDLVAQLRLIIAHVDPKLLTGHDQAALLHLVQRAMEARVSVADPGL